MPKHTTEIEWVSPDALVGWDRNPTAHPAEQIRQLANGIERFGFVSPIIVFDIDGRTEIRAGHGRLAAMRAILARNSLFCASNAPEGAPIGAVPILRLAFASRAEADAFGLSDQAIQGLGKLDEDAVSKMLRELSGEGVNVTAIGFDDRLDVLLDELVEETDRGKGGWVDSKSAPVRRNVTVELSILVPSQFSLVEQALERLRMESPSMTVGEAFIALARAYLRG